MTKWLANEYSLVKALGAATSQAGLMSVINDGSGTTSQWEQWGATPGISGQMEESFVGSYLGRASRIASGRRSWRTKFGQRRTAAS